MPVAYSDAYGNRTFTNNLIPLLPNDCIYIFSDGYADQFGSSEDKDKTVKFLSKRMKAELLNVCHLPMNQQKIIMENHHDKWKGKQEQTDDVLLIGIRI